jgi:hypothetical protein
LCFARVYFFFSVVAVAVPTNGNAAASLLLAFLHALLRVCLTFIIMTTGLEGPHHPRPFGWEPRLCSGELGRSFPVRPVDEDGGGLVIVTRVEEEGSQELLGCRSCGH